MTVFATKLIGTGPGRVIACCASVVIEAVEGMAIVGAAWRTRNVGITGKIDSAINVSRDRLGMAIIAIILHVGVAT